MCFSEEEDPLLHCTSVMNECCFNLLAGLRFVWTLLCHLQWIKWSLFHFALGLACCDDSMSGISLHFQSSLCALLKHYITPSNPGHYAAGHYGAKWDRRRHAVSVVTGRLQTVMAELRGGINMWLQAALWGRGDNRRCRDESSLWPLWKGIPLPSSMGGKWPLSDTAVNTASG